MAKKAKPAPCDPLDVHDHTRCADAVDHEQRQRRAAAGKLARKAGRDFEKDVDKHVLEPALERGVLIHRQKSEPRMLNAGLRGAVYGGRTSSDFIGTLAGGLALALEVKSTAADEFARAKISELQLEHLDAVVRAGGLALLAIQFRRPDGAKLNWLIPWARVPWRTKRTAQTLHLADLTALDPRYTLPAHLNECNRCGVFLPKGSARLRCLCGKEVA